MRTCGACFWGVFEPREAAGACHNRPPFISAIYAGRPGEVEVITLRPEVMRKDMGCYAFRHPKAPPKDLEVES